MRDGDRQVRLGEVGGIGDGSSRGGFDPHSVIHAEVAPGERLVWWGRPDKAAYVKVSGPARMFGLIFGGVGLVWVIGAGAFGFSVGHNAGEWWVAVLLPLTGLPFVLFGAVMLLMPGRRALGTVYGLTDRRAVVVESRWPRRSRDVKSYSPKELGAMEVAELPDGRGSVIFERVDKGYKVNGQTVLLPRGFLGVPDVARVAAKVRELAARTKKRPAESAVAAEE
ncbi:MAG: hypothetical protein QM783_19210 [Phycisphaerales bacterium]